MKKAIILFQIIITICLLNAKSYKVELFEAKYSFKNNNKVMIEENIGFNFQKGNFTWVDRELSPKRIDALKIVNATIDDKVIPFGIGINRAQVSSNSIKWNFSKSKKEKHHFGVHYLVDGAIYQTEEADIFEYALLPNRHNYSIDSVRICLDFKEFKHQLIGHRLLKGEANIITTDSSFTIINSGPILKNQSIHFQLYFKKSSLISENPKWFALKLKAKKLLISYLFLSAIFVISSTVFSVKIYHKFSLAYKPLKNDLNRLSLAPENFFPGEGAFLLSQSIPEYHNLHYIISSILEMLNKRQLQIKTLETPKAKKFAFCSPTNHDNMNCYEKIIFDALFFKQKPEFEIEMKKGLNHVNLKTDSLTKKIKELLLEKEYISPYLTAQKRKYTIWGVLINILGFLSFIPFIIFFDFFTVSSLLLIFSIIISGIILIVGAQSISPLTPKGLHASQHLYYFKKHLIDLLAQNYDENIHKHILTNLSWVFAFNLQSKWYAIIKNKNLSLPNWFDELSVDTDFEQFYIIITTMIVYSESSTTASVNSGNSASVTGGGSTVG